MPLLNNMAQGSPLAGLLAQRRQAAPQHRAVSDLVPELPEMQRPMAQAPSMPTPQPIDPSGGGDPQAEAEARGLLPSGQDVPLPKQSGDSSTSIRSAIRGLFGGTDDPRLSGEENRSARRQGLIAAGVVGLGALTGGASIAGGAIAGAIAGRGVGDHARAVEREAKREDFALQRELAEQEALERRRAEVSQIFHNAEGEFGTPEGNQSRLQQLLARGHLEEAEALQDFIDSRPDPVMVEGHGHMQMINPETMEVLGEFEVETPPAGWTRVDQGAFSTLIDNDTGMPMTDDEGNPVQFQHYPRPGETAALAAQRMNNAMSTINMLQNQFNGRTEGHDEMAAAVRVARQEHARGTSAAGRVMMDQLQLLSSGRGQLRERSVEAILQSAGFVGGMEELQNYFSLERPGDPSPTVMNDLMQAIENLAAEREQTFNQIRESELAKARSLIDPEFQSLAEGTLTNPYEVLSRQQMLDEADEILNRQHPQVDMSLFHQRR